MSTLPERAMTGRAPGADLAVVLISARLEARGRSVYTWRLAEGLAARGARVVLVCPDGAPLRGVCGSAVAVRECSRLEHPLWGRLWLWRNGPGLISESDDDPSASRRVVVNVLDRQLVASGLGLARRLGGAALLTVHDATRHRGCRWLDCGGCRRLIAVSGAVESRLRQTVRNSAVAIDVVPAGVPGSVLETVGPAPLEPGHTPVIGTVGPFEPEKGTEFFLAAARRVVETGVEVEFLVAGAGPDEANLRRLARELGIAERVTFASCGLEVREAILAMDIFCLPALEQGLGTLLLEAMAQGRPVIATETGGVSSVLTADAGLLVPAGASHALADAMLALLRDPLRGRRLGVAGRERVKQEFPLDAMIDRTLAAYTSALERLDDETPAIHPPAHLGTPLGG